MSRNAFIRSSKLPRKSPCPSCSKLLDGVTGVGIDEPAPRRITGRFTLCTYCGALLVFADEQGRLRTMSAEERARALRLDPVFKRIIEEWRRTKIPNLTRKSYGSS